MSINVNMLFYEIVYKPKNNDDFIDRNCKKTEFSEMQLFNCEKL